MNVFVADPEWGWWIILYFFLGGIAAGAYFTATLVDLVGREADRDLPRVGYWIAFPLVVVCGIFLTVDLDQPLRFWHMLLKSETGTPLLKPWSPMSIGSWALLVFGFCSFLTFLGSLRPAGGLAWLFRRSILARVIQAVGCVVGFFVASYTGALLTATNQPIWSDTTWVAPLFLASAASTGMAAMLLVAHFCRCAAADSVHRLERSDLWAVVLETVVFVIFLISLGGLLGPLWDTWQGKVFLLGTAVLGLAGPLLLHLLHRRPATRTALTAAVLALVGGFLLRFGLLQAPGEILARARNYPEPNARPQQPYLFTFPFSPEDDRVPGKSLGADPLNRPDPAAPADVKPRSKFFGKP